MNFEEEDTACVYVYFTPCNLNLHVVFSTNGAWLMADMVCRKTTWLVPMLLAGNHGTDGPINNQKVHNGYIFFFFVNLCGIKRSSIKSKNSISYELWKPKIKLCQHFKLFHCSYYYRSKVFVKNVRHEGHFRHEDWMNVRCYRA